MASKGGEDSNTTSKYFSGLESKSRASTQPTKRTHSEVSEASGDEVGLILSELAEIKDEIKSTVKSSELDGFVKNLVNTLVGEMKTEMKNELQTIKETHEKELSELRKVHEQEQTKSNTKIDALERQIVDLIDKNAKNESKIRITKKQYEDLEEIAYEASMKANYNEQYSRKNNIKIHGVKEVPKENTLEVTKKVLEETAKVTLKDDEIVAIHRIPGKKGYEKPILIKVKNSDIKARVMRQRPVVRKAEKGLRLADDVTKSNSDLIQRLNDTDGIYQAWYFNGSVYAKASENGHRIKFDIYDDVEEKLKEAERKKKQAKGESE